MEIKIPDTVIDNIFKSKIHLGDEEFQLEQQLFHLSQEIAESVLGSNNDDFGGQTQALPMRFHDLFFWSKYWIYCMTTWYKDVLSSFFPKNPSRAQFI